MTDKATLLALAERCEKATGPDRFIDSDIAAALSEWENLGGHWEQHKATGERRQTSYPPPPAYTSSLDAALTLVPLDHHHGYSTGAAGIVGVVQGHCFKNEIGSTYCEANAATPALALTAACLRARAA